MPTTTIPKDYEDEQVVAVLSLKKYHEQSDVTNVPHKLMLTHKFRGSDIEQVLSII